MHMKDKVNELEKICNNLQDKVKKLEEEMYDDSSSYVIVNWHYTICILIHDRQVKTDFYYQINILLKWTLWTLYFPGEVVF